MTTLPVVSAGPLSEIVRWGAAYTVCVTFDIADWLAPNVALALLAKVPKPGSVAV